MEQHTDKDYYSLKSTVEKAIEELDRIKEELKDMKRRQDKVEDSIVSINRNIEMLTMRFDMISDTIADIKKDTGKLSEELTKVKYRDSDEIAKNASKIKISVITAIATLLATGAVTALIEFLSK